MVVTTGTDGSITANLPDGVSVNTAFGPDPLWGIQASSIISETITTPGQRVLHLGVSRQAQLADPADLFSIVSASETWSVNGRAYIVEYNGDLREFTLTTPEGRQRTTQIDESGQVVYEELAGLHPASYAYDAQGRMTAVTFGSGAGARIIGFGYNGAGDLVSVTNAGGSVRSYVCDANGRVVREILGDGAVVDYAYDGNGNVVSISPPGRPAHTFAYSPVGLAASYTAPGGSAATTSYEYDADRRQIRTIRPDGSVVDFEFSVEGTLAAIVLPSGSMTYGYDDVGRLSSLSTPNGVGLAYTYDGVLLTSQSWSGPVAGAVQYTYDNDFRLASVSVNGTGAIPIEYDGDGELTRCGDLVLTRDAQHGLKTQGVLGNVTDTWTYDGFGKPVACSASFGGTTLYATQYSYDGQGRMIQKVETVGADTHTFDYQYDVRSRLIATSKDGSAYSSYTYDANDNRLSYTGPGGAATGTYDDRDRLVQYGAATYESAPTGDVVGKTDGAQTTVYRHDALGFLTGVTLPDATRIDYVLDGHGRHIGRKVNDVLTRAWLYEDNLRPAAELDGAGNVASRFVYAEDVNVPAYMIKGGAVYRLITDPLGSPRLVVDTATGAIAQRLDYDEFGKVLQDTAPGFQPFGFAGGLYDTATGLTHFGAREYDARTGRWMSRDPILFDAGQTNLYAYVDNDPVNLTDPSGTCDSVCQTIKGAKGILKIWKDPRTGTILRREFIKAAAKAITETAEEKAARFAKANAQRALQSEAMKAMLRNSTPGSSLFFLMFNPGIFCKSRIDGPPDCPWVVSPGQGSS